ncbi:MAG TPA: PAS domain S-box protein, partial [Nitrospiria bacterium]|nr:PAS domain S-box protein [Nitrospiria bacterium]
MIRSLFRLIVLLGLIFAGIWGVHTSILLKTARESMADEANRRLMAASHSILSEVRESPVRVMEDFPYLRNLVNRFGIFRVAVLDRDGTLKADSHSALKIGEEDRLLGATLFQIGVVYGGAELVTAPYLNEEGVLVRSFFSPARDTAGSTFGVLRVDIRVSDWEKSGPAESSSLLMKVAAGVILLTFLLTLFRWLVTRPDFSSETDKQGAGTAAVIETFHGLVRKLKDKEAELEHLRSVAEKKADSFESYNENILQSVSSGVISFNTDRIITSFNQAAEKVLGMARNRVLGKTCEEAFGPSSPVNQLLNQALDRRETTARKELELERHGNGSGGIQRIWVGVSTSLLRDNHNKLIGTTFVFTDLTEIKHLQERVEINRRLTVLGEMSAGIAHEFRNYMGTVMGFTKLLSKKIPVSDPGQEMADAIMAELKAMNVLIEQLLSFGRHDELNLRPVNV